MLEAARIARLLATDKQKDDAACLRKIAERLDELRAGMVKDERRLTISDMFSVPAQLDLFLRYSAPAAQRAVRRAIADLREPARRASAAPTEEVWSDSRNEALERNIGENRRANPELVEAIRRNLPIMRMLHLIEALIQGVEDADRRDDREIVTLEPTGRTDAATGGTILGWEVAYRETLADCWKDVPVVLLDATGERRVLEHWLSWDEIVDPEGVTRPSESSLVRQIRDAPFSYNKWKSQSWYIRWLRAHIEAAAVAHRGEGGGEYDVGVALPRDLLNRLEDFGGPLPSNVGVVTFGAEAGVNALEAVARMIVISRPLPPPDAMIREAEIWFGVPIQHAVYDHRQARRLIRLPDGEVREAVGGEASELMVQRHPDERVEAVRRTSCEAVFDQARARAREHRRKEEGPVLIDLLSNVESRYPVDEMRNLEDWKERFSEDFMAAAFGWAPRKGKAIRLMTAAFNGHAREIYMKELSRLENEWRRANAGEEPGEEQQEAWVAEARRVALERAAEAARKRNSRDPLSGTFLGINISLPRNVPDRSFFVRNREAWRSGGATEWHPAPEELASLWASWRPARVCLGPENRPVEIWVGLNDEADGAERAKERLLRRIGFPVSQFTWLES